MIPAAIVTISGFTEGQGKPTGSELLWQQELRPLACADLLILPPVRWSHNMRNLALFLNRQGIRRLCVVAYSWGVGVGLIALALACRPLGITIDVALCCDGVARFGRLPSWLPLNPLSLTRILKIRLPPSIAHVYWVRQRNTRPMGHDLIAANKWLTAIHEPQVIAKATHSNIDESPEWHEMVRTHARKFAERVQQ